MFRLRQKQVLRMHGREHLLVKCWILRGYLEIKCLKIRGSVLPGFGNLQKSPYFPEKRHLANTKILDFKRLISK